MEAILNFMSNSPWLTFFIVLFSFQFVIVMFNNTIKGIVAWKHGPDENNKITDEIE